MASDATGTRSVTNTLSGTTADTVTLQQAWGAVEVENHSTTVDLFVRFDGTAAVTDANECERIAPSGSKVFHQLVGPGGGAKGEGVVSVVGNGQKYTVAGVK